MSAAINLPSAVVAQHLVIVNTKPKPEPKDLTKAKQVGLKVTDIDPNKDAKLSDFIKATEGVATNTDERLVIGNAYQALGVVPKRPTDKKLAKRYDAARKRLKTKGLLND